MSVTEIAQALGEWSIKLKPNTPIEILDQLEYFGHIAISAARVDPEAAGDALLESARYVGVLRDRGFGDDNKSVKGVGMNYWLGDEEDKGDVIEEPALTFTNATFSSTLTTLLPDSVGVGTIAALSGLYNGSHQFVAKRKAIDYVCSLYDAEYRVRGSGVLDAGLISDLYVTEPKAAILRNRTGLEMDYRALPGRAKLDSDVRDLTTRVVLLAEGSESSTISATADINPALNPYVDLFGNPVKLTRIVSEQQTSEGNAPARAQLQLNRFTSPRDSLSLSTATYDIKGTVAAGDYVWVYDPEAKLINTANRIDFHGQEIYPLKLRTFEITWPVAIGMGVAFRTPTGEWLDLTDYVEFEQGDTTLVVGGYNRSLTGTGASEQDPGSRPLENSTTPDAPTWNTPFTNGTYQSGLDGLTRAQIVLDWDQPLNTDNSVITDGGQYEIRMRTSATSLFPMTHTEMNAWRHNQLLGTHSTPIPFTLGQWTFLTVGWDNTQFLLQDLTPGIPYDFQVRAYDNGTPANVSDWSDLVTVQTRPDTQAPSTPAAPQSIAGSRNAVQVVHTLGKATGGGTYNLESDINHFRVHSAIEPTYTPINAAIEQGGTLLGRMPANQGMIKGQIPAIATFQLNDVPDTPRYIKVEAVDNFGNVSPPSAAVVQTAELIDTAFISELTVSRVSAGFINSVWVNASEITTATSGARVVIAWYGIEVFNNSNLKTLDVDSTTGDVVLTGTVQSGFVGRRVVISGASSEIQFMPEVGETRYSKIYSYIPDNYPNDVALELRSIDSDTSDFVARHWMLPDFQGMVVSPQGSGGDFLAKTGVVVSETLVEMSARDILGIAPFVDTDEVKRASIRLTATPTVFMEIRNSSGVGLSEISSNASGDCFVRRKGTGEGACGIDLLSSSIKMYTNGAYEFEVKTGEVRASKYAGFGGTEFHGVIQDGGGGTFSVRNDPPNTDPILDANGFSPRFVKNFVIDHPQDKDRWLVHACTETPEAAVEYSGTAVINSWEAEVILPAYFEAEVEQQGRQVWLQVMLPDEGFHRYIPRAIASFPKDGKFRISSDGDDGLIVSWKVKGIRKDVPQFEVEPLKSEYSRQGIAPYTWLEKK